MVNILPPVSSGGLKNVYRGGPRERALKHVLGLLQALGKPSPKTLGTFPFFSYLFPLSFEHACNQNNNLLPDTAEQASRVDINSSRPVSPGPDPPVVTLVFAFAVEKQKVVREVGSSKNGLWNGQQ